MNRPLYLLLSISLAASCSFTIAMDKSKAKSTEQATLKSNFTPEWNKKAEPGPFEKIATLTKHLELSMDRDDVYYGVSVYELKTDKQDLKDFAAKTDHTTPLRFLVGLITKLNQEKNINPSLLENAIRSIPPYKLKYTVADIRYLPTTATTKKLESGYFIVEDNALQFKDQMLGALYDTNPPFKLLTPETPSTK